MEPREPCQMGNQAALSDGFHAPQFSCPLYAEPHNGEIAAPCSVYFLSGR